MLIILDDDGKYYYFHNIVILLTKVSSSTLLLWNVRPKRCLKAGVALGKGEVSDCPRPHLKIKPHFKFF